MTKYTVSLAICMVALMGSALSAPSISKISPVLQRSLATKDRVNIFVDMKEGTAQALASVAQSTFATRAEQTQAVYNVLNELAATSQKSILEMINSPKFFVSKVESFWISNQVFVAGADKYLIEALAARDDVAIINEEAIVYLDDPAEGDAEEPGTLAEYGVEKVQAPAAWAAGYNGNGAVAGVIDTGARYTHVAIAASYRGGTHSWRNPYSSTQNPGDGHGHGTHCTGTIAGSQSSGIGVAPGAKWISCKGLNDQGSGTQAALTTCGQFMTCPTTYTGASPNCALAPDVVSNSWGGGSADTWYNSIAVAWKAAGIIPVFAQGNSGPSCSTANSPGDSAEVIGVGATTATDAIASFSSRGPGPSSRQKPDVSAPGNAIRSAGHTSDAAYASMSGTSMACPHVAGVVALLKGKNKNASYTTIKNALQNNADTNLPSGGQTCGGVPDTRFPNFTFGYGRVNAVRALNAV